MQDERILLVERKGIITMLELLLKKVRPLYLKSCTDCNIPSEYAFRLRE